MLFSYPKSWRLGVHARGIATKIPEKLIDLALAPNRIEGPGCFVPVETGNDFRPDMLE
jgi:hypothetical protein